MESMGNTRHQDLSRRPALMISRIVSAAIALFFVVMMPAARQPGSTQLFAAAVQSTALSQPHQGEDAPKPAVAEFQSLLASGNTAQAAEREQPEKESDKVLQQFLK
jgi:hypothetical protein